jgi:hypothetical protein
LVSEAESSAKRGSAFGAKRGSELFDLSGRIAVVLGGTMDIGYALRVGLAVSTFRRHQERE